MGKNILITGGAGFIGSNLALRLLEKGFNVTVLDNLSPQIHGNNPERTSFLFHSIKNEINFIKSNILSRTNLLKAIQKNNVIVHFAAETGTGQSMYQVEKYSKVNVCGTALLLDILVNEKLDVEKVIVASSRAIYGEGKYISKEKGIVYPGHRTIDNMSKGDFEVKYPGCEGPLTVLPTDEESKIHPSSVYGITKYNQEQIVMTVCPSIGINPVAFRYQNVYGPGQSLKNPYTGILSIFSTQIKNGYGLNIFEDGNESRDFVYIDDVVDATILGIEKDKANGEIFNVGTGIPTTVMKVAQLLVEYYGKNVPVSISGNYRVGDIRHNYADISKIKSLLDFKPKFTFEKGLKEFTDWVNTQNVHQTKYEESIKEMRKKGLFR